MGTAVFEAGPRGNLTTAEAALDAFCDGFDPALATASEAADVFARASVMERKMVAVKALAARRVESSSAWKHAGHRSMPEWMAARTGEPVSASAGLLDTARKLETVPATAKALAAGDVSIAAAREIAAAVAVDPNAEAQLLAVAADGDHRQLVDNAAKVRQAARSTEDEATRHARLRRRRFVRTRTDADGLVLLHGGFAPTDWAPFAAALQRGTDGEFTKARRQGRREPVEAYAADALLGLLGAGLTPTATARASTPSHAAPDTNDDPETSSTVSKPSTNYQVVVLIDAIALKRGYVSTGERCEIAGVGPVSVEWVEQLLPEAIIDALVHNGVDITTYASATRSIRKAVKLAVKARDWRCVVRGCGRSLRTQRDHRHDYAKGGKGSTDNLNLLCEFHHRQKTNEGARLDRVGDGWHWYPPGATQPWISQVGANLTLWDLDSS